jgi:hypothetical protein
MKMRVLGDNPKGGLCPQLAKVPLGGRNGLSWQFAGLMALAGLDPHKVQAGRNQFSRKSFHSLRHSFSSALANIGVSADVRMKLTGHKSVDVHRRYTHMQLEPLKAAIAALPRLQWCPQAKRGLKPSPGIDQYFDRVGFVKERDAQIMDLVEELEKVARAEAGDLLMDATLESRAEGILTQWKKKERDARHNLDDAFFEKVARAIRSLKSLETEVTANSPPSQFAVVAALQATKIISNQNALPPGNIFI